MIMIMTVRSNEWKYDLMKRRLVHDSIEVESLYIKTLPAAAQPFRWRCGVVQLAKAFVWRGTSSACCGWKHGLHHHVSDFAPQSRHCVAGLLVTQRKEFSAVCTAVSVHTRGQIYHTIPLQLVQSFLIGVSPKQNRLFFPPDRRTFDSKSVNQVKTHRNQRQWDTQHKHVAGLGNWRFRYLN